MHTPHPRPLDLLARELAILDTTTSLLHWDAETGMPPRASAWRAEQTAYLASKSHHLLTRTEVDQWIREAMDECDPSDLHSLSNLRLWRRQHDQASKLPAEFVETWEKTTSLARDQWVAARASSSFSTFEPWLTKLISLARDKARYLCDGGATYDVWLDLHDPGVTCQDVRDCFGSLVPELRTLLSPAMATTRGPDLLSEKHPYPQESQVKLNRAVLDLIGFDWEEGALALSAHPFSTTLGPCDSRITTRYTEDSFLGSLYGTLHEGGHALYSQGLPKNLHADPVGQAVSYTLHESQSRLWENIVGRSQLFAPTLTSLIASHFPQLADLSPSDYWRACNKVEPSHIRTEADEVTYNLHIALRFEIEAALFDGTLEAAGIPTFWNELSEKFLGIRPPDDANGCLQDIHWSAGLFGYFPSYTLGNLASAQIYQAATAANPTLEPALADGNCLPLLRWLQDHIHSHASLYPPQELLLHTTGARLHSAPFLLYLKKKFL